MNSPYDPQAVTAIMAAMATARLAGRDDVAEVGADAASYAAAYMHEIKRDSLARSWWKLPAHHPAIAKALRVDPAPLSTRYALLPFRYVVKEGRHLILAAHPAPCLYEPADQDWLGIETVIAWEPATGKVKNITNPGPQLFGRVTDQDNVVYADPRAFFMAWMRARAWYHTARAKAAPAALPPEMDMLPGALMLGDPAAIAWPIHTMPRHFECVGIDPQALNRAILKAARVPMCRGQSNVRAA